MLGGLYYLGTRREDWVDAGRFRGVFADYLFRVLRIHRYFQVVYLVRRVVPNFTLSTGRMAVESEFPFPSGRPFVCPSASNLLTPKVSPQCNAFWLVFYSTLGLILPTL